MRVTLIHNPGAGSQNRWRRKNLVELLRRAGHEVRYQSVKADGWDQALREPADLVVIAGGDGTVSRVAKRMVARSVPLAALPLGTANNISRTLGLIDHRVEELVRGWPEARRVKLDVGVARGPWGKRYFVEGVGTGLFTCLLSGPRPKKKRKKGVGRALQMLLERVDDCRSIEVEARVDGKDVSGQYILFEALNILYVGPSLFLAPDSKPGDGTFNLALVTEAERDRLREYLSQWQTNKERLAVLPSHRGKHLEMEWDGYEVHIDDELWPQKKPGRKRGKVDVHIAGAAVEFLAPKAKKD